MKKFNFIKIYLFLTFLILILNYQNCSNGFNTEGLNIIETTATSEQNSDSILDNNQQSNSEECLKNDHTLTFSNYKEMDTNGDNVNDIIEEEFLFSSKTSSNGHGVIQRPIVIDVGKKLPVVIFNHGKGNSAKGWSSMKEFQSFSTQGVVAIARDFFESDDALKRADQTLELIEVLNGISYVDIETIGMYGHSMGSATTSLAISRSDNCLKNKVKIAFWSAGGMYDESINFQGFPIASKVSELLNSEDVTKINIPVHFLHGVKDTVIPVETSRFLDIKLNELSKIHT